MSDLTQIHTRLKSIISAILHKCTCKIKTDVTFNEFNLSNEQLDKFVVVVNNTYEIDLRNNQLTKYTTIDDLAVYIDQKINDTGTQ